MSQWLLWKLEKPKSCAYKNYKHQRKMEKIEVHNNIKQICKLYQECGNQSMVDSVVSNYAVIVTIRWMCV